MKTTHLSNVDDQRTSLVRHVVPRLVSTPDLQARDGDREKEGGEAKVCMTVHPQSFGGLLRRLLDRSEEGVSEIPLAGRGAVRLDLVPKVVVRQLEDTREEGQKPAVDGLGEVLCEVTGLRIRRRPKEGGGEDRTLQKASISSMKGCKQVGILLRSFHSLGYQLNCSMPSTGPRCFLKPKGCL